MGIISQPANIVKHELRRLSFAEELVTHTGHHDPMHVRGQGDGHGTQHDDHTFPQGPLDDDGQAERQARHST